MKALGTPSCIGAQVDVRQGRLGHCRDDAGDAGKLVGQHVVEHYVAGVGPLVRPHDAQQAVAFPRVHRDEVPFGADVFVEHEVDSGFLVERQVALGIDKIAVWHVIGKIVIAQRQAGGECRVGARYVVEAASELQRVSVDPMAAIGSNQRRIVGDLTVGR